MVHLLLANRRDVALLVTDVTRLVPMVAVPRSVPGVATNAALNGAVVDLGFVSPLLLAGGSCCCALRGVNPRRGCHRFGLCCRRLSNHDAAGTSTTPGYGWLRLVFGLNPLILGGIWWSDGGTSWRSTVAMVVLSPTVLLVVVTGSTVVPSGTAGMLSRVRCTNTHVELS